MYKNGIDKALFISATEAYEIFLKQLFGGVDSAEMCIEIWKTNAMHARTGDKKVFIFYFDYCHDARTGDKNW